MRPQKRLGRRLEEVAKAVVGRLLSVTNAFEAGTWRQGDSGWATGGGHYPIPSPPHARPLRLCRRPTPCPAPLSTWSVHGPRAEGVSALRTHPHGGGGGGRRAERTQPPAAQTGPAQCEEEGPSTEKPSEKGRRRGGAPRAQWVKRRGRVAHAMVIAEGPPAAGYES